MFLFSKLRTGMPLLLCVALLGGFSCSNEPPQIQQFYTKQLVFEDAETGEQTDRLAVFLQIKEPSDIEFIYLIHDDSELYWQLTSDQWYYIEREGENWLGTNAVVQADRSPLPRGNYRLQAVNFGGDKTVKEFTISTQPDREMEFPEYTATEDGISLPENGEDMLVWWFSGDGQFLETSLLPRGNQQPFREAPVEFERLSGGFCYLYSEVENWGMVKGPFAIR